jgi:hypothetical protein
MSAWPVLIFSAAKGLSNLFTPSSTGNLKTSPKKKAGISTKKGVGKKKHKVKKASKRAHNAEALQKLIDRLETMAGGTSGQLMKNFATTLVESPSSQAVTLRETISKLEEKPVRIGVLDVEAYIGQLPGIIDAFNRVQDRYLFSEVQAPLPVGLFSEKQKVIAWAKTLGHEPRNIPEISLNLIADDFFPNLEAIRKKVGVDYLGGITPARLSGTENGKLIWNCFSLSDETRNNKVFLCSTHELIDFSAKSGFKFEAFIAHIFLSMALAVVHDLTFDKATGGLFDSNIKRATLIDCLRNGTVEEKELQKLKPKNREAVLALMKAIVQLRDGNLTSK